MKALNEIKERAEAFEEVIEGPIAPAEVIREMAFYLYLARRDIPRLCEALEYLFKYFTPTHAQQHVDKILSGTIEKGKDADGKKD